MIIESSLLTQFVNDLAVEAVLTAAILIGGYLYRVQIGSFLKKLGYYIGNEEVRVHLKRVDKYSGVDQVHLDHDLFVSLRDSLDAEIRNPELGNEFIRIEVDDLPTKVTIRLDETHDFTEGLDRQSDYKVVIETDSELRFGYRSDGSLDKFQNVSSEISNLIQNECFGTNLPNQSYILGEMRQGVPPGTGDINDQQMDLSAHVRDSTMYFTLKDPNKLSKSIKKYFNPIGDN